MQDSELAVVPDVYTRNHGFQQEVAVHSWSAVAAPPNFSTARCCCCGRSWRKLAWWPRRQGRSVILIDRSNGDAATLARPRSPGTSSARSEITIACIIVALES